MNNSDLHTYFALSILYKRISSSIILGTHRILGFFFFFFLSYIEKLATFKRSSPLHNNITRAIEDNGLKDHYRGIAESYAPLLGEPLIKIGYSPFFFSIGLLLDTRHIHQLVYFRYTLNLTKCYHQ